MEDIYGYGNNRTLQNQRAEHILKLLYDQYEVQLRLDAEENDRMDEAQLKTIHSQKSPSIIQRLQRSNPFPLTDPAHLELSTLLKNKLDQIFEKIKGEVVLGKRKSEDSWREALEYSFYYYKEEMEGVIGSVMFMPEVDLKKEHVRICQETQVEFDNYAKIGWPNNAIQVKQALMARIEEAYKAFVKTNAEKKVGAEKNMEKYIWESITMYNQLMKDGMPNCRTNDDFKGFHEKTKATALIHLKACSPVQTEEFLGEYEGRLKEEIEWSFATLKDIFEKNRVQEDVFMKGVYIEGRKYYHYDMRKYCRNSMGMSPPTLQNFHEQLKNTVVAKCEGQNGLTARQKQDLEMNLDELLPQYMAQINSNVPIGVVKPSVMNDRENMGDMVDQLFSFTNENQYGTGQGKGNPGQNQTIENLHAQVAMLQGSLMQLQSQVSQHQSGPGSGIYSPAISQGINRKGNETPRPPLLPQRNAVGITSPPPPPPPPMDGLGAAPPHSAATSSNAQEVDDENIYECLDDYDVLPPPKEEGKSKGSNATVADELNNMFKSGTLTLRKTKREPKPVKDEDDEDKYTFKYTLKPVRKNISEDTYKKPECSAPTLEELKMRRHSSQAGPSGKVSRAPAEAPTTPKNKPAPPSKPTLRAKPSLSKQQSEKSEAPVSRPKSVPVVSTSSGGENRGSLLDSIKDFQKDKLRSVTQEDNKLKSMDSKLMRSMNDVMQSALEPRKKAFGHSEDDNSEDEEWN